MSSLLNHTRTVKPVQPIRPPEWAWGQRPLWPCEMFPQGLPGMLILNGQPYMVTILADLPASGPAVTRGFRLTTAAGKVYDQDLDGICDCPDCTFRGRQCKHSLALRQALASIGYPADPAPTILPMPRPTPRYRSLGDLARNDPDAFAELGIGPEGAA